MIVKKLSGNGINRMISMVCRLIRTTKDLCVLLKFHRGKHKFRRRCQNKSIKNKHENLCLKQTLKGD